MNFFLLLWIPIFLTLRAETARAKIHIEAAKHITAGLNTTILWTRNETDPTAFAVATLRNGESSELMVVYTAKSETKGNLSFVFSKSGKFQLVALEHKDQSNATKVDMHKTNSTLFKSKQFEGEQLNSRPTTSPTPSATSTVSPHSQTPVILAVCLGTVLFAVIALFLVYYVLHRRRRRSFPKVLDDQYAFSHPPQSTHSRSWMFRNVWDSPTAQTSSITLQNQGNNVAESSWPDTLNFYHTPRSPPKAFAKNTSSSRVAGGTEVSNHTETSLSSMHFSPKTERQMEIEERIEELRAKLALLQRSIRVPGGRQDSRTLINMTHNMRIGKWRNQIEKLQEHMSSDWALGRTDVIPKGLYGPESI
ncbi:hypothetical protein F5890DRAFT_1089870 [Lentinula detonsa]|uniref:Uncharacterized protein n=1 Tax=Lentinula detonsa TaxID=2804962 RepID=A0AA38Q2T5_9AGAR|nr:hypothetical protein F5890DRAFT_1089870 [Lentinula detonsa]